VDEITDFLAHQLQESGVLTVPDAVRAVSAHWPRFGVGSQLFMTVCAHLQLLADGGSARYSGDPDTGFEWAGSPRTNGSGTAEPGKEG
jgi:hypothetical protein